MATKDKGWELPNLSADKVAQLRAEYPAYIERGSERHVAMLGIEGQEDPKERAKLQAALEATPEPSYPVDKRPILPTSNPARRGEHIVDGWRRS